MAVVGQKLQFATGPELADRGRHVLRYRIHQIRQLFVSGWPDIVEPDQTENEQPDRLAVPVRRVHRAGGGSCVFFCHTFRRTVDDQTGTDVRVLVARNGCHNHADHRPTGYEHTPVAVDRLSGNRVRQRRRGV